MPRRRLGSQVLACAASATVTILAAQCGGGESSRSSRSSAPQAKKRALTNMDGIYGPITKESYDIAQREANPAGVYMPKLLEGFTRISPSSPTSGTGQLYFSVSTWQPYYGVLLRADFSYQ